MGTFNQSYIFSTITTSTNWKTNNNLQESEFFLCIPWHVLVDGVDGNDHAGSEKVKCNEIVTAILFVKTVLAILVAITTQGRTDAATRLAAEFRRFAICSTHHTHTLFYIATLDPDHLINRYYANLFLRFDFISFHFFSHRSLSTIIFNLRPNPIYVTWKSSPTELCSSRVFNTAGSDFLRGENSDAKI